MPLGPLPQILTFLRDRRQSPNPPSITPPTPIVPTSSNGHFLITPLTPAADGMPPPHCRPPSFACPPSNPAPLPVPGAHLQALNEIAKRPFDAAELFSLHQYYFSPPAVGTQPTRGMKQQPPLCHVADPNNAAAAVLIMGTRQPVLRPVDSEEHLPPCKRQCNNLTTTPITYYPRLKVGPFHYPPSSAISCCWYLAKPAVQSSALLPFSPLCLCRSAFPFAPGASGIAAEIRVIKP